MIKRTQIEYLTPIRVILDGLILNDVSRRKLDFMIGSTRHRLAVAYAVDAFNRSEKAITGIALRYEGDERTGSVDVQIDLVARGEDLLIKQASEVLPESTE